MFAICEFVKDSLVGEYKANILDSPKWTKAANGVLGIMASILVSRHFETAGDLFGGPEGTPRTDAMVAAAVQWAERIMKKIDNVFGKD